MPCYTAKGKVYRTSFKSQLSLINKKPMPVANEFTLDHIYEHWNYCVYFAGLCPSKGRDIRKTEHRTEYEHRS
jgi:hypothetical protein